MVSSEMNRITRTGLKKKKSKLRLVEVQKKGCEKAARTDKKGQIKGD